MRVSGLFVQNPKAGRFYLLRRVPEHGNPTYMLSSSPGRTSTTHAELAEGLLSTKDGVAWYAEQAVEVFFNGEPHHPPFWSYRRILASELARLDEALKLEAGETPLERASKLIREAARTLRAGSQHLKLADELLKLSETYGQVAADQGKRGGAR
jgi:exonuclease VII small subunit